MKILILFLISFSAYGNMYLKIDGETIMGHAYSVQGDYNIEIGNTKLVNSDGDYKYKYVSGGLVLLSNLETNSHPNKIKRLQQQQEGIDREALRKTIREFPCENLSGYIKLICRSKK